MIVNEKRVVVITQKKVEIQSQQSRELGYHHVIDTNLSYSALDIKYKQKNTNET